MYHQPSEWEQTVLVESSDLYHRSPDSGELQYKARGLEKAICSHSEGWWYVGKAVADDSDRTSVTLSVGTPLCPYGIAYHRVMVSGWYI
jgi:hypothetical protein